MKVLVVEDSLLVLKILKHLVSQQDTPLDVVFCESYQQAKKVLESYADQFYMAMVDLNLPDAPQGEIVELAREYDLPTVVLTATFDNERREMLLASGVVDYVVKESRYSYEYAMQLMQRLRVNCQIKILIVDDSRVYRMMLRRQLESYRYQVLEAEDGVQALDIFHKQPDIQVLISDYHMPNMDGVELVKVLRRELDKSDLVFIGLSSSDNSGALSAQFIKNGANDFLRKPFNYEELHCRVTQNLETIELLHKVRDAAYRDVLTGLFNRRYLFEKAPDLLEQAKNTKQPLCVAMADLDFFKRINDGFGHDAGDEVLRVFTQRLSASLSQFLLTRVGGEEFCLVFEGLDLDQAYMALDRFRAKQAAAPIMFEEQVIEVTMSAGLAQLTDEGLDEIVKKADLALYQAKESGRNIVCRG